MLIKDKDFMLFSLSAATACNEYLRPGADASADAASYYVLSVLKTAFNCGKFRISVYPAEVSFEDAAPLILDVNENSVLFLYRYGMKTEDFVCRLADVLADTVCGDAVSA